MNQKRQKKIGEEIRKIVSEAMMFEMKDPRLPKIISVTEVEVSGDLTYATIYVSAFGLNAQEQEELVETLQRAKGFFRSKIGKELKTYKTPDPIFKYDHSIEKGMEMDKILRDLKREDID